LGTFLNSKGKEVVKEIQAPWLKKETESGEVVIILTGGYTNPTKPWISEAEEKKSHLIEFGIIPINFFLEERSIRTTQNIRFSFRLIGELFHLKIVEITEIIFTGEAGSEKEVKWLAPKYWRRFLKDFPLPEIRFFPAPYLSDKRRKQKEGQLLLIKISYYFPLVDLLLSLYRWGRIRVKCWKKHHILCTAPFHWGCEGCKLKEVIRHKILSDK